MKFMTDKASLKEKFISLVVAVTHKNMVPFSF
jgi:hypothetical protein